MSNLCQLYLNISCFDNSLSHRPGKLKDFMHNYIQSTSDKENFELQKGHTTHTLSPYKNFFLNKIVNIFTFTSSIISMITITLVIYLYCKHKHIRTIIASLILHKAKEVEAKTSMEIDNSECGTLAYIGIASNIIKYGDSHPFALQQIKILQRIQILKHCKNCIVYLRCTALYTIKLCKTAGSPHLFKIIGTLNSGDIRLNKNYLWDTLEINWDKITFVQ